MRLLRVVGICAGSAAAACNGHDQLCGRRYSNVTMIGTHNSAFVGDSPFHNQFVTVTEQLDSGVRFLQAQTHDKLGEIQLCHTSCLYLDVGPLARYLQEVADWLAAHPDDVVTMLLTNIDAVPMDKFDAVFGQAGLKQHVFRPGGTLAQDQWPTLRELIKAGTRLVVFMGRACRPCQPAAARLRAADYHADQTQADYILNEFDFFWETPYGITDSKFPTCRVDRPAGGDARKLMGIMNHMLNIRIGDIVFPNMIEAAKTNSLASIQKQVDLCRRDGKPQPNVILVSRRGPLGVGRGRG